MDLDAIGICKFGNLFDLFHRCEHTSDRELKADDPCGSSMNIVSQSDPFLDVMKGQVDSICRVYWSHHSLRQHCQTGSFFGINMGSIVTQHRMRRLVEMDSNSNLIAHGARK